MFRRSFIRRTGPCIMRLKTRAVCVFLTSLFMQAVSERLFGQSIADDFLARAEALMKQEQFAAAEQVYLQGLAAFPEHLDLMKGLGINYQTQLKFQESVATFERILQRQARHPEVNFYLGLSYLGMNLFEKAVAAFQQELELNPKYRRARYYLSIAFQSLKQPVKALEQLHILNDEDPSDARVLYELTRTHQALAMQALNQLSQFAPDSDFYLALRAETYAKDEKYSEAIRLYQELRQKNPKFPGIHFALGELYWKTLRTAEAETELELALKEDPNHPTTNFYLGELLLRNQKPQQALPLLQIAVTADPGFAPAHFQLGKCYLALRNLDLALSALVKAAELNPDSKMTHYQLARVYSQLGDVKNQKQHLAIFQKLDQQEKRKKVAQAEKLRLAAPNPQRGTDGSP